MVALNAIRKGAKEANLPLYDYGELFSHYSSGLNHSKPSNAFFGVKRHNAKARNELYGTGT
jgi:hypothetical protein